MMADEELQLLASVNFIKANKLDRALRNHDWAGFARGYNGAGYRKNAYDTKLADAYRKWSRIKDTPPAATTAKPTQKPASAPAAGLWAALFNLIKRLFTKRN